MTKLDDKRMKQLAGLPLKEEEEQTLKENLMVFGIAEPDSVGNPFGDKDASENNKLELAKEHVQSAMEALQEAASSENDKDKELAKQLNGYLVKAYNKLTGVE